MGKYRGFDSDPGWIGREFKEIWKAIREDRAAKSLEASTIGAGGLTVEGGGAFRLIAADGAVIFEVISNTTNPDPDGNPQPTVRLRRVDGSSALILEDPLPGVDGYKQILRLFDRAGHEILAEDATSGLGLANPWLGFSMYPSRYTDWPKSTSGSFEETWVGYYSVKNPTVTLGAKYTSDTSGTTGECRFKLNGTVVGSTKAFGFGIGTDYLASQSALPAGVSINDTVAVTLEVRRTAGTGNVMCAPIISTGSQSA